MSLLAEYLGITDEELDELGIELHGNTGSSGEMVYEYYFEVPDYLSEEVLEKMCWKAGETIYVPLNIVSDYQDDTDIDNEEMRWIRSNPHSSRFDELIFDLDSLHVKLSNEEVYLSKLESKMFYSYAVTLFEAFLSETAKYVVANNEKSLAKAAIYFSQSENAEHFKLDQILNLDITKYVIGKISGLTFHNPKIAQKFLSAILHAEIDLSRINEVIKNSHDIVHRNGKRIDGTEIMLSRDDIKNAFSLIEKAAKDIQDKWITFESL